MSKKQELKSDTTRVDPRYVVTNAEMQSIKKKSVYDTLNDTTRLKNQANIVGEESLIRRNAERVRDGQKPLPKPKPTIYAKDLDPKAYISMAKKKR